MVSPNGVHADDIVRERRGVVGDEVHELARRSFADQQPEQSVDGEAPCYEGSSTDLHRNP